MRPGDDLDEIFAADGARRIVQGEQPVLLRLPEVGRDRPDDRSTGISPYA